MSRFHLSVTSASGNRVIRDLSGDEVPFAYLMNRNADPMALISILRSEDGSLVSPMYPIAPESGSRINAG